MNKGISDITGYTNKETISNNIRFIMPKLISDVHNDLIKSLYVGHS